MRTLKNDKFWKTLEFNRFAIMSFTIIVGTGIASIALFYLMMLKGNDFFIPLMLISSFAMASNTAAISQSPIKWVIGLFLSSLIVSILVVLYSLL